MPVSVPFLRIPPFPGARAGVLSAASSTVTADPELADGVCRLLAKERVGGMFWGAQPELPVGRNILLFPDDESQLFTMIGQAQLDGLGDRIIAIHGSQSSLTGPCPRLAEGCDPWFLVEQAEFIWAGAGNEAALVAALCRKMPRLFGDGPYRQIQSLADLPTTVSSLLIEGRQWRDPFTGEAATIQQVIATLGDWRRLIDSNRSIGRIYGVARWKRETVDALFWSGSARPPYARCMDSGVSSEQTLLWTSRTPRRVLRKLGASGTAYGEIEDGFIRSSGLGANCVPPLSIVVDHAGIYFDPQKPSTLESILEQAEIGPELTARAAAIRAELIRSGVSKYGRSAASVARIGGDRRHVLVTGQVEDDRSMLCGGEGVTNSDLVRRARQMEPDAYIIFRPHPDVEAGHRKGAVADDFALAHVDHIDRGTSIAALLDSVDAVHVITSLAGFEALMRGKAVTTHGVPFYAGWGLTRDLGQIPARRTRTRTLDELVAAALILYPRYVDPVTRLPCPPEVVIARMARGEADFRSPLIWFRQMQGRLNRPFRRIRTAVR